MTKTELSELTDQELLEEGKRMKSAFIINAVLIGFMVGIFIYGAVKNNFGLLALIPLFFVLRLFNKSKHQKELEELLKERNLK